MADPALQGTAPSNKTTTNSASNVSENLKNETSPSFLRSPPFKCSEPLCAGSLSLFSKGVTVQRETLSEESQQEVARSPHKSKCKNDSFVESGSRTELNDFSMRLVDTEKKYEDTDKGVITTSDSVRVPKARQKQMVTEVSNLEEKRTLNVGDAMLGNDISEVIPARLFNFQHRKISDEPKNSCLAINQSGETSPNISSISPRSRQHSFSPYGNSELAIFTGGKTQNNKTGCASLVSAANSLSALRTQPISTRKPPLPPGAVAHLKGELALKANKVHIQNIPQYSRKRLRVSEITTKKIVPAADSDKERCVERGNSHPSYRSDIKGSRGGLTTKSVMFHNAASAAANPLMNLVTLSDNIQPAFPGSSGKGKSLHQQDILAFSNDNKKKILGSRGNYESNNKNDLRLDHKRTPFQRPQYCATGKAHFHSFFEEKDRGIQELTLSKSLCGNDGAALQVTKGSLQNISGLLSTTPAPINHGQDPSRSLATSLGEQVSGNIAKSSNQSFLHFKSSKTDNWHDREPSSPVSSTEKSKYNVSMRKTSSTPGHSLQNIVEMQVQASRASSTASHSCEDIVEPYYNAQTERCQQIERGQMTSMRIDSGSCNMADVKAPVIASQVEGTSSMSAIVEVRHNSCENVEEYRHGSRSCSIDVEVGKVDVEKTQQSDKIKDGVCMLGSRNEGEVFGADLKVVQSWHDRDLGSSRTENLPPKKVVSSHLSAQPLVVEQQMDVDIPSSPEFCMDVTQERWSKRLKRTLHSDDKVLESSGSEMVGDSQGKNMQVFNQRGGFKGCKHTEAVKLHHRVEVTKESKEALGYNRLTAREKHCDVPVPNQGDAMPSTLGKCPHQVDHQGSSSFLDQTALKHSSLGQNTMDPTPQPSKSKALQTKVSSSSKGASSRSQEKIDMASILSHPWIQHWRPSYQIASPLCQIRCGSLLNKEINRRSLRKLFARTKMMPSAAAMAIVGIAARQIRPYRLQNKGSFSVWTAVGGSVNGTVK